MARVGGILIAAAAVARYDRIVARMPARRDTGSALFDSLDEQLGHRRNRRHRADGPWLDRRASAFCSCCRSTRCRRRRRSPYSALSAMAIDPQFISMAAVEDFEAIGGEASLDGRDPRAARRSRGRRDRLRDGPRRQGSRAAPVVRAFPRPKWASDTRRAAAFRAFCAEQSWWLDDYALFRALHAHTTSDRGPSGRPRCATASRRRSRRRVATLPTTSCFAAICSGWQAINGGAARRRAGVSRFLAICRSW